MKRISLLLLAATVAFASCKEQWKKGDEGVEYKIIAEGKGEKVATGQFMEMTIAQVWNDGKKDSILNPDNVSVPAIIPYDSLQLGATYYKIFKDLKKGDSIVTRLSTDSMMKKNPGQLPPFMKKGQFIYTNARVINIYKTKEEADKANEANMKIAEEKAKVKSAALVSVDDKTLTDYLTKNNIKATRTANGTYVEILQPGTGPNLDTNSVVKVNYTGKLLNGAMFDSNTDPSKGHTQPLSVNLTNNPSLGNAVVPGMTEGFKLLNKGAKARLYIPSGQGYGPRAMGADLPANSNLVFDVEILDVLSKTQAAAEMEAMQKKYMEMQKQQQAMQQSQQPQQAPAQK